MIGEYGDIEKHYLVKIKRNFENYNSDTTYAVIIAKDDLSVVEKFQKEREVKVIEKSDGKFLSEEIVGISCIEDSIKKECFIAKQLEMPFWVKALFHSLISLRRMEVEN